MPPRVDNNAHAWFENRLIERLESMGFAVSSAAYHEILSDKAQSQLSRNYSAGGLYLRLRADRIAIRDDMAFEFEPKTHENHKYCDMTIEALQLMHHVNKLSLGVDCLYAYYNPNEALAVGFWVSELPPIRGAYIPENTPYWQDAVTVVREQGFPLLSVDFKTSGPTGGSGDPFLIIDHAEVRKLRNLKDILDDLEVT
jgi:hypothetical protein